MTSKLVQGSVHVCQFIKKTIFPNMNTFEYTNLKSINNFLFNLIAAFIYSILSFGLTSFLAFIVNLSKLTKY